MFLMTHATASAEPEALPEGMAWELGSLRVLGDLCMELAQLTAAKAKEALTQAADEDAPRPRGGIDPVLAFSRIARAVRMTVGLHAKIRKDRQARAEKQAAEQAVQATKTPKRSKPAAARGACAGPCPTTSSPPPSRPRSATPPRSSA